jgi:putative membrane protein
MMRRLAPLWMIGLGVIAASAAWAQGPGTNGGASRDLMQSVISTVVFGFVGIVLAIAGFKLFDVAIRFDLEKEICEKNNIAVALLAGAMLIGICIIVAAVLLSP